jgi:hypothetical protein
MGKNYFVDGYNRFDFTIICITILTKLLEGTQSLSNKTSILRIFRLGRLLRLVARASYFRMIFTTFVITLPSLFYIGILLMIILYIYSVLGMEFFAFIKLQDNGGLTSDSNFSSFDMCIITLFRAATGEGWNGIMDDMYRK